MAKKNTTPSKTTTSKSVSAAPTTSTAVRNSAIPPKTVAPALKKTAPTHDQIAKRAYEISQSGRGGSQDENWYRAERELRGA